ncbi:imelysin family protein [Leeia sp.]|uniref:imelysin family protein n=1 Tax=Leeia sp. TaxID=2884678 RepID=UPI0035B2D7FA
MTLSLHRKGFALLMAAALTGLAPAYSQAATDVPAVLSTYADMVHASYQDASNKARELQKAVDAFVAKPSADGLQAARKAWLAAREPYGQTEVYRFYGGPIDDAKDVEGRLNSWPLDEVYIDMVKGKPNAGLINNPKIDLAAERLIKLNTKGGEANIVTGYHAVEFMLWGQDFNPQGPGDRAFTDFVDGQAKNADRRRQYLKVVTDQLVADLDYLTQSWQAGSADNFRSRFLKDKPEASLRKVLTGMAVLSSAELSGERMQVALDNQDQEDEHSCFSDNTHRDIVNNALGIQNVYLGSYKRVDGSVVKGPSLKDLVADKDPKLADKLAQDLASTQQAAEAIQAPFDQEIIGKKDAPGRKRVQATIALLKAQTKTLVSAARAIGINKLSVDAPN